MKKNRWKVAGAGDVNSRTARQRERVEQHINDSDGDNLDLTEATGDLAVHKYSEADLARRLELSQREIPEPDENLPPAQRYKGTNLRQWARDHSPRGEGFAAQEGDDELGSNGHLR